MAERSVSLGECYLDEKQGVYCTPVMNEKGEAGTVDYSSYFMRIKESRDAEVAEVSSDCIYIKIKDEDISCYEEVRILAAGVKNRNIYFLETQKDMQQGRLKVDIASIGKELEIQGNRKFNLLLEYIRDGRYFIYSLCDKEWLFRNQKAGEKQEIAARPMVCRDSVFYREEVWGITSEHLFGVYAKADGLLKIIVSTREHFIRETQPCILTDMTVRTNAVKLGIRMKAGNYSIEKVILRFRSKLPQDDAQYQFQVKQRQGEEGWTQLWAHIDLGKTQLKSLYWDVFVILKQPGGAEEYKLFVKLGKFEKKLYSVFYDACHREKEYFLFPYGAGGGQLAFQYREKGPYDTVGFRIKERIAAVLYKVLKKFWRSRNIWLVYEKFCLSAQDNGYYFFHHCMENNAEAEFKKHIYYIIDRNAPDRVHLEQYKGHILDFMSLKHMIYALAAETLISTDTKGHAYALKYRNSILAKYMSNNRLVFLQHGVTALKQVDFFYGKGKPGGCELFVVTSDFEKKIVEDNFGYADCEIANTGFARWDVLKDKSQGSNQVLVMPTWRSWLDEVSDEAFQNSDYFRSYMELLNSKRLKEILEEHNLQLSFYLHSKFREFIRDFQVDSPRIRLISFGEEPVNEIMMASKMLITDYSSVCWDMLYMGKPVAFYQFDLDKYEAAHGSYLDMRKELFGPRTEKCEELLDILEGYAAEDFRMEEEYGKMRNKFYKYIDQNNSRRICQAIKERW